MEASDALTKAVTIQQRDPPRCAKGMVEASDAVTKAVANQQYGEARRYA